MKRWFAAGLALALAFAATARSIDAPLAIAPADATCHASVDEAAIEALSRAMALADTVEHGGAIYERGSGCFVFSTPVTTSESIHLVFKTLTSRSQRLAGLYHTHTTLGGLQDAFSAQDVFQARASKVPSFVGVHGFNHIRKLRTGYADYGPGLLADRAQVRHGGVRGTVLVELPPPASCRTCS